MNLTSSETQTACEQKRSLIHFPEGICYQDDSVKRFLLKHPVVSMINIFLTVPVTILPLNMNYVTEVLSQIQSFN